MYLLIYIFLIHLEYRTILSRRRVVSSVRGPSWYCLRITQVLPADSHKHSSEKAHPQSPIPKTGWAHSSGLKKIPVPSGYFSIDTSSPYLLETTTREPGVRVYI